MQRSDRDEAARLLADAARPLLGDEGEAQFAASLHQIGVIPGGQGT
jgi:hypothetical protein